MDPSIFTDAKPGELRKFFSERSERECWLFIPEELPPRWEFPTDMWPLLVQARETLGTLNGIGTLARTNVSPELLMRPLQSREAITSSGIEGTFVTPQQLLLYELNPEEPSSASEPSADLKEVWNYSAALHKGLRLLEELPLASRLLLEMHKVLMAGVRGHDKAPGEFRVIQNQIRSVARYVPPPALELPRLMGNFDKFINGSLSHEYDPLVACFLAHYQFEAIHPFIDGNGRLGRVLLTLMVQQQLQHTWPWLYISAYFEEHRDEYVDLLLRVSTHGDWTSWIRFCLTGTIHQAKDAISRCVMFYQKRAEFHQLIKSPSPRSHLLIDHLFSSPIVTITSVSKKFGIRYTTAKKDIARLTDAGILTEIENAKQKTFMAADLIRIAYSPHPADYIP